MLRLMGRAAYRVAWHMRRTWLRLVGGTLHGTAVIGLDSERRILLVRHSYGSRAWSFPGGGKKAGEDPLHAARREFAEELGCEIAAPEFLGHLRIPFEKAENEIDVFCATVVGNPRPDGLELTHAAFFSRNDLPEPMSKVALTQLELMD